MANTLNDIFETILARIRALEARSRAVQSYYNFVVNGGFEVWSGGAGPFTVNGPIADTWLMDVGGTTLSVSQDTVNMAERYSVSCASCAAGGAGCRIYQTVTLPLVQPDDRIAISARVRCATPGAVRLSCTGTGALVSQYHSGSDKYETLVLFGTPLASGATVDVAVEFAAACVAYVDNVMAVQGAAPIDYIAATAQDEAARIVSY